MAAKPHLFGIARGAADPPPTRFVSREIFVVAAVPTAASVPATRRPLQKNRQSLEVRMLFRSVRLSDLHVHGRKIYGHLGEMSLPMACPLVKLPAPVCRN